MTSQFNLSQFRSQVLGNGLARPNRFEVLIVPPTSLGGDSQLVSLMCESTNFPPKVILSKPFKIFGPSEQRPNSVEHGGDGITAVFHVDRQMKVKRFFDEWMNQVVLDDGYFVQYKEQYVGTVTLVQLDEQDNKTYSVVLEDAFPRSLNLLELNNSTNDQTHRLSVTFAYRRWRPE